MIAAEADVILADGACLRVRSPRRHEAEPLLRFVRELAVESWRNLGNPPEYFDGMSEKDEAEFIDDVVEHPSSFLLVAWEGDVAVASLGVTAQGQRLAAHCAELGMGVLRRRHRMGLGTALLAHGIREAERVGLWNLSLKVRTYNAGAIALYERTGFLRVGTLRQVAAIDGKLADEYLYQRLGTREEARAQKTAIARSP